MNHSDKEVLTLWECLAVLFVAIPMIGGFAYLAIQSIKADETNLILGFVWGGVALVFLILAIIFVVDLWKNISPRHRHQRHS